MEQILITVSFDCNFNDWYFRQLLILLLGLWSTEFLNTRRPNTIKPSVRKNKHRANGTKKTTETAIE